MTPSQVQYVAMVVLHAGPCCDCRLWFNAPFVILGLWDERQDFQVPLFNDYREQAATPFVVFRGTLQAGC